MKNDYQKFLSENFTIFGGNISVCLNRHVFVMTSPMLLSNFCNNPG